MCVCATHQNVKLMIAGANLNKVTLQGNYTPLKTYQHCLSRIMCNPPTQKCFLDDCDSCPTIDDFKEALLTSLEEDMIDKITYKQWLSVDHCSFETICKSTEDFVDEFSAKLNILKKHDFINSNLHSFKSRKLQFALMKLW